MSKTVNLYLDKGADFSVIVQIIGIGRRPIDLHDMEFASKAKFMMKESMKVAIQCIVERPSEGLLRLIYPIAKRSECPSEIGCTISK